MSEVHGLSAFALSLMMCPSPERKVARLALRDTSLVRIEHQLTQGEENNDADDRRKEYGREGSG